MLPLILLNYIVAAPPVFGVVVTIPFVREPLPGACAFFYKWSAPQTPGPVWLVDSSGRVSRAQLAGECPVNLSLFPVPGLVDVFVNDSTKDVVAFAIERGTALPVAGLATSEHPSPVRLVDGILLTDVTGDGVDEAIESCAAGEGFYWFVWKRKEPAPLFKSYGYLGYDIDSNCRAFARPDARAAEPPPDTVWTSRLPLQPQPVSR